MDRTGPAILKYRPMDQTTLAPVICRQDGTDWLNFFVKLNFTNFNSKDTSNGFIHNLQSCSRSLLNMMLCSLCF